MVFNVKFNAYGDLDTYSESWCSYLKGWERGPVVYPGDCLIFDSIMISGMENVLKVLKNTDNQDYFIDWSIPAGVRILVIGVRKSRFADFHRSNGKFGWVQQVFVPMYRDQPPEFIEIML